VAHQRQRLAGRKGLFDESDGLRVLGQVPQRAVAAGVEHGVKVPGLHAGQRHGAGQLLLRFGIGLETARGIGLGVFVVALGVQRRLAAVGRCQGDLRASVLEHVVRGGKLFQPEARLFAGVAQLVVGRENHEDVCHGGRFL